MFCYPCVWEKFEELVNLHLQITIRVGPKWAHGWVRAFIVVSMEGRGEAGQTGLGLATQNNFGKLWGRGAVPVLWYLLLGWHRVMGYEHPRKDWLWVWALGSLVCIWKHAGWQVVYYYYELVMPEVGGGAVSPESARPQMSKHQNPSI